MTSSLLFVDLKGNIHGCTIHKKIRFNTVRVLGTLSRFCSQLVWDGSFLPVTFYSSQVKVTVTVFGPVGQSPIKLVLG